MREYLTLHRSVYPSYLTIESGRMYNVKLCVMKIFINGTLKSVVNRFIYVEFDLTKWPLTLLLATEHFSMRYT